MASDDLSAAAAGGPKVKLLCSSGGRILPRPSDNTLRYVGGDTRIVTVRRDSSLSEILRKMADYQPAPVHLRYQLPDEDLDALISVTTQEDLDNMFDEYDKLVSRDPAAKLRVFLFPPSEVGSVGVDHYFGTGDLQDVSAKYLEAVNGVERKDSVASFSSNGTAPAADEGMVHTVVSPTSGSVLDSARNFFTLKNDSELPPFHSYSDQGEMMSASQPPTYVPQVYVDQHPLQFINNQPYVMLGVPPLVNMVSMPPPPQTNVANFQVAPTQPMQVNSGVMPQARAELNLEGNHNGTKMPRPPSDPKLQPLSQLPPLPPPHLLAPSGDRSGARQGPSVSKGQGATALPHAYSDPLFNEQSNGPRSTVFEAKPVLQSHHSDNMTRIRAPQAMTSGAIVDAQLENLVPTPTLESYGFKEASLETLGGNERQILNAESQPPHTAASNVDNHEQPKLFSQPAPLLVPSKHLISPSLSPHDESGIEHIQLAETIGSKNPVKQDTKPDTVAAGVIFGESVASQHSQFMHENFPVPANSNIYARPMMPMSNTHFISPTDASVFTQQFSAVASTENGTAIESKPKISQLGESNKNFKPQNQPGVMPPIYSPVVPSGATIEQNASPPAEPLLPGTSNYFYIQNLHHPNASYMSHVAGSNSFSYLEAVVGTNGLPAYVYDNTVMGVNPIVDMKDMDPNIQFKEAFSNQKIPAGGNSQINVARNVAQQEKLQESTSSNSLFFNDDPQKILGSSSELSTISNISNKEPVFMQDMHHENISTDRKGLDVCMLSEGNLTSPTPNQDLLVETAWPLQGSEQEHVEQDMLVSAEGKKAPAQSLSKPPRAVLNSHESKSSRSANGENENNAKTDDDKNENTKARQSDKASYGFPNADDIGHRPQVIHNDDLEELQELGSGTFGTVYHGKWRGTDVAIKRLNDRVFSGKQSEQERAKKDFWNEASKLASLHHPNVVAFYGIVLDGPGGAIATVTEYMVNGSLRTALQNNDRTLDRRRRLIIAMDVAFGMEYLHSRDIIHFDLKSDNLLVNLRDPQRPICKVGDLGLSKLKYETLMSGGMRGTLPWMAPEILGGKKHSEKVDVFSFGIVMWELLTGEEPYADLHYGAIIGGIINNTLRPPVPETCDPEWRSLMEQCWSNDPSERPSFTEIANRLRQMAASLPQKK